MKRQRVPTARDIMTRSVVRLRPQTPVSEAIATFLRNRISGAPVVDEDARILGLLSEFDCLRALAAGEFHDDAAYAAKTVGDLMSRVQHTIPPELDLYGIAHAFLTLRVRRLPVVEDGRLVGQVSRRDVLRAVDRLRRRRHDRRRYPDYPEGREPIPDYPPEGEPGP